MKQNCRSAARILSLAVLLSLFSSCAWIRINDPGKETTSERETTQSDTFLETEPPTASSTPSNPEKKAKEALAALRLRDLGEATLLIATTDTSHAFSQNANLTLTRNETVYAERMERIAWVEERYNVRIIPFTYTEKGLYDEIVKAEKSDAQYVADYYAIPASVLGKFAASGFLMDLRIVPFTDYSEPYFDQSAMDALSAGHSIYGAVGDLTRAYDDLDAIYFNKDLTADDLYGLVFDGKWTWDAYFSYAKEATDTDSGISGDNLGLIPIEEAEARMWGSAAFHPITAGLDKTPKLSTKASVSDTLQKMADMLYTNVYKKAATLPLSKEETSDGGRTRFANGTSLFYHGDLSQMYAWANIPVNWGILPLPKYDEAQKSYTNSAMSETVFCVPSTTVQSDKSGLVLQAMFAASCDAYEGLYLNDALTYYIRDGKTADMLDVIVSGTSFDFSSVFSGGYPEIAAATVDALHDAITTKNDAHTLFQNAKSKASKLLSSAFPADR